MLPSSLAMVCSGVLCALHCPAPHTPHWLLTPLTALPCIPTLLQAGYAWGILGLWAGLLGTFAATLRDRGLINRPTEMAMVGLPFGLFLALVAYSIVRMDDAWDLMRSIADPVYVMQVVRMVRLQVA